MPIGNEAHLIQFSPQWQAAHATVDLPFVALGGGQKTADPFLAFIRRTFWPTQRAPSLGDGIFAILWSLNSSSKAQPGGIGDPVQIATLSLGANWKAKILSPDELGPHQIMVEELERELPNHTKLREQPSEPIPES